MLFLVQFSSVQFIPFFKQNFKMMMFSMKPKILINLVKSLNYSTKSRVKTIDIKTCGQLYEELRQKNPKLYGKSPTDGLNLNVEYVDTLDNSSNKSSANLKTVVAIHGIPGYHHHFNEMINYFSAQDSSVRLIVPNLPDFKHTRQTMAFWHSNRERAQFIRDFLKKLNVNEIDCLVSHSAGIHPISLLWSDPQELKIKSVCLLCPQPLWRTSYFFRLSKFFSFLATNKVGIKFLDAIKPHLIAHKVGYPMSYANVDEVLLTVTMASNGLDQNRLHQRLEYLRDNKVKNLVVYGERDKLILPSNFEYLVRDLGADQRDFVIYSDDCKTIGTTERKYSTKVLWFKGGGHFAFNKYSQEVNKNLVQFCLQSSI